MVSTFKGAAPYSVTFLHVGTMVNVPLCNSLHLFCPFLSHPDILTILVKHYSTNTTNTTPMVATEKKDAFSDAAGSWGCGAWSSEQWLQVPWPPKSVLTTPAVREVFTIVVACAVWGQS